MQLRHKVDANGHNYIYLVKPRQFGFTTDYAIDMLDDAAFVPGASSGIIAHDRETLGKIFAIIKRAYDNMPERLKPVTKYDTRNEYKFLRRFDGLPLDNELYVALDIRGSTVQRLHVSEAAHIKDRAKLKMGAKQAVPLGGRITEETTGNGLNEFYDDVMDATEKSKNDIIGPMDYKVCFYPWFMNSEYTLPGELPAPNIMRYGDEVKLREKYHLTDGQLLWRRWKLDEFRTGENNVVGLNVFQRFQQEYPATLLEAFQSGAGNIFDLERLMAMNSTPVLSMLEIYNRMMVDWELLSAYDQELRTKLHQGAQHLITSGVGIWHLPQPGKRYVIGVDPSDGEGSDNTDMDVWLIPEEPNEKLIQVAQFYGKIRPDRGADLCADLAKFYNNALTGVENNMLSFILFLSKIYDNYYMQIEIDKKTLRQTPKLGWNTNNKTRDPMIDDFIILHEDDYLEINSAITIGEMKTFVKKDNGKREHADNKHDDSLIGGMIALQMRKYQPRRARVFAEKPAGF